jgi:hypothetical protein
MGSRPAADSSIREVVANKVGDKVRADMSDQATNVGGRMALAWKLIYGTIAPASPKAGHLSNARWFFIVTARGKVGPRSHV